VTTNLLYAVGTLLTWSGWFVALRTIYLLVAMLLGAPDGDRGSRQKSILFSAFLAAALLIVASLTPMNQPKSDGIHMPLVWFAMPFVAWMAVVSVVMVVIRWIQAWLALNQREKMDRVLAGIAWLLAGAAFVWLFKRDPDNKVQVFVGSIPMSVTTVAIIALLALACVLAMALSARYATARGWAKTSASHAALIAGSLVFGLPFAFLVITSFKEDRDMSSQEGIVWIPRVQETVPYKDPKNPLYETSHEGQRIVATIMEKLPSGGVRVEVQEPRAILGTTFDTQESALREIPRDAKLVTASLGEGKPIDGIPLVAKQQGPIKGMVVEDLEDGGQRVRITEPAELQGKELLFPPGKTEPIRHVGLRWQNYTEAISFLPPETNNGLVYLKNTLLIVIFSVIGTILSSSIVAYAFSRLKFPGRDALFMVLLSTMMLPAAVTMLPQFLIFRYFGWIDTLYPLWVPAFFASAFNVFLLRQFFKQIPMELEDAAKIDGASYLRTFWQVMLPQIKPALAVIAIWTFMGAWNNFMGPLIYINSPENMPLSYALQLFNGDRGSGEPGLLMAFATMTIVPVLLLFFFAQRYFIEGVTLSGFGGR
jgi:multiple sugar transport system permease protein